jgi:hypothetical protein
VRIPERKAGSAFPLDAIQPAISFILPILRYFTRIDESSLFDPIGGKGRVVRVMPVEVRPFSPALAEKLG